MMIIYIKYDSCWRNSFLDGSNNEPISKKNDRKFIASSKNLKNKDSKNFIQKKITEYTVIGVLNRLIGDQRKLYLSRGAAKDYYFKDLEDKVKFNDDIKVSQQEVVYLKNINGHTIAGNPDKEAKSDHKLFNSSYSKDLWSIWNYEFDDLIKFILDDKNPIQEQEFDFKLANIEKSLLANEKNKIIKIEDLPIINEEKKQSLKKKILDFQKKLEEDNNNYECKQFTFYSYAFHEKIKELKNKDLIKEEKVSGISANSITKKDFYAKYFNTPKKISYGNPYIALTKSTGTLTIKLDISKEEAQDLRQKIWDAGVSPFYLGKKGLAYVKDIIIKN